MSKKLLDLELEYQHHTDKAVCVKNDQGKDVWLPKSMAEFFPDPETLDRGDRVEVTLSEAYALEKELI